MAVSLLSASVPASADDSARSNFKFHELVKWGRGINNKFKELPSGFEMQTECRKDEKSLQTACATRKMTVVGQDRLVFTVTGTPANKSSKLTVSIIFNIDGKKVTKNYNKVPIKAPFPKTYMLGMTEIFDAPDLPSEVLQLKFQVDSNHEQAGHVSKIKITDVAIRSMSDIGSMSGGQEISVLPSPRKAENIKAEERVKVFFDLDNDDGSTLQEYRRFRINEKKFYYGFRDRLMQNCGGIIDRVNSPANADVIVSARVTPSPVIKEIVAAVKKGAGLVVYGDIFDKEINDLLPVELKNKSFKRLPPREKLRMTPQGTILYSGGIPAGATYAVFRDAVPRPGAKVLSKLGDSPSAVLSEDGKILYSSIGIGVTQVNSSELYDRFFLNAAALTARKAGLVKIISAQEKCLALLREIRDRIEVCDVLSAENGKVQKQKQVYLDFEKKLNELPMNKDFPQAVNSVEDALKRDNREALSADGMIWRSGAHQRNFGRFGWEIAEGVLGVEIGSTLSVVNNAQEYQVDFDPGENNTLPLDYWNREPVSGKVSSVNSSEPLSAKQGSWSYKWTGEGEMLFTAEIVIPDSWKGQKISFEVAKGIDDTDITMFNGKEIGRTQTDTPNYWEVRRSYRIPANLIRWGKKNKVQCKVGNLKGDSSIRSRPMITIPSEKRNIRNITVSSVDWMHKQYTVSNESGKTFWMTATLAIPYILYETKERELFLNTSNLASAFAFVTESGLKHGVLREGTSLYDRKRDGNLKEGWMLLWDPRGSRPFALYFTGNPEIISTKFANNTLSCLQIRGLKNEVIAGWPFGASNIKTSEWEKKLPESVLERMRKQAKLVYTFPIGAKEAFAISGKGDKIHIRTRLEHKYLKNEFGITPSDYAILPPIIGMAVWKKMLVECPGMQDFDIATEMGPVMGRMGKNTLDYTITAPPAFGFHPIGIEGFAWEKSLFSDIFNKGIRWSAGGHVPERGAWTPQKPHGKSDLAKNFGLNEWALNTAHGLASMHLMTPADMKRSQERMGWRFFEPLERYGFKLVRRYREEPFSGIRYAVFLPPCYQLKVPFSGDYGSRVLFGDQNEQAALFPLMVRLGSQFAGQGGAEQANWNLLRDMIGFSLASEDWALTTSGCRESWQGAHIDMMNCEYPAMREYEWLCRANGDQQRAAEAVYRAARRMIPTLMRFYFHDYMRAANLNNADMSFRFITGWREVGGASCVTNMNGRLNPIDVFDLAGSISEHILVLYKLYANDPIRDTLLKKIIPNYRNWDFYEYNAPLAVFGMPKEKLAEILKYFSKHVPKRIVEDHPGMNAWFFLGLHLFGCHPEIFIDSASRLNIKKAVYDPERREAVFDLASQDNGSLKIYTAFLPEYIRINNRSIPVKEVMHNGLLQFEKLYGDKTIRIGLSGRKNELRNPMIKNLLEN